MNISWGPERVRKDGQSVAPDWTPTTDLIDGVTIREVRNVLKAGGAVTELIRADWFPEPLTIEQVFQVRLEPGALSAWHSHERATDRLFAVRGIVKLVLCDLREGSASHGAVNEFFVGALRPRLIVVPPKVWHGVQNVSQGTAVVINMPDRAYCYEDPDHWRLSPDTDAIPYRFERP